MSEAFLDHIRETLRQIEADGLTKLERPLKSHQGVHIDVANRDL